MQCADSTKWLALADGRLGADEEVALREHAATCESCAPHLALIDQKRRLARDAPTQELSSTQLPRPVEPAPVLERGTSVGRFVIIDTVGMGGMGAVYSAWDPDLDRRVALKTLHVAGTSDATAHGRMLREAQAMARLSHPNVVNVFDVGEHRGGIFIAMEFVPGVTLRTWERAQQRSWREVVSVFLQAGRGLAAAHAAHLVHRDFKPANVLLGEDGRARVTDFGVARADGSLEPVGPMSTTVALARGDDSGRLNSNSFSEPLTRGDMVVGTVGYMSPEQAEAKTPDARSDQFAFCICLWEGLYGKRPFTGNSILEVTSALMAGVLPPRPRGTQAPNWVHTILLRGLQRDPEKRYPTMEALLAEFERAPDEWKRKALPWAAVMVVLVMVGGLQLGSRAAERGRCEAIAGELSGVWDEPLRAQVVRAFDGVNKPFAAAALASAQRALDSHAKDWTAAATQSCEQAFVRKEIPETDYRLEAACLAQRKRELAAVVTVLASADEGVVERAGTMAWSLTPVRGCTQLSRLRTDPRLLASGGDQARVTSLQLTLARARSLIDAGKLADAAPLVDQALASAQELNRRALEAEALSLLGALHYAAGKYAESADAWTRAALAAQACGFDEAFTIASIQLTTVVGFHLARPAEGRVWDSLARATIERMGGDDVLTLDRMRAIARLASVEGKRLEVAAQHLEALTLAKTILGPDHPRLWLLEFDTGNSLADAKDPQGAVPHLERALQLREKEVSSDHPEVVLVRGALANAYFYSGRVTDSREAFTRTIATREKLFGPDSPRLIVTLNNFGDTLSKSGRHEEAEGMVARAQAIAKKAYPPNHPYVAATVLTHAEVLLAMGRRDAARTDIDAVLALRPLPIAPLLAEAEAVRSFIALLDDKPQDALGYATRGVTAGMEVGARSPELVQPLLAEGESQLALANNAAAISTLERALALVEESRPWRVYGADARFALARAKAADKREPDSVKQLATEALEIYRASEGQSVKTARVEQFLAGR